MRVKLTVLGCSALVPSLERGQSGYLLETEETKILIEAGITVPRSLEKFLKKPLVKIIPELDAILISHQHTDHIDGLITLIGTGLIPFYWESNGDDSKIDLYLPGYSEDLRGDIGRKFPEIEGVFEDFFYLEDFSEEEPILSLSPEIRMRVEKMTHSPYFPCFGFRFTVYGKIAIAYSGDTTECSGLYRLLENPTPVDLAVIDATSLPKGKLGKQHLDAREAGRIAEACGVKELILTHISHRSREEIYKEAKKEYSGKLSVAKDGMRWIATEDGKTFTLSP